MHHAYVGYIVCPVWRGIWVVARYSNSEASTLACVWLMYRMQGADSALRGTASMRAWLLRMHIALSVCMFTPFTCRVSVRVLVTADHAHRGLWCPRHATSVGCAVLPMARTVAWGLLVWLLRSSGNALFCAVLLIPSRDT